MRTRRFDLIVFDWDGTLFDSTTLIARCIQAACADLGVPVPSDRDASYVIGLGLADALAHAAPGLSPRRYPELASRYRHHYFARHDELTLFDGSLELLRALKQRDHWLGVATGKSRHGLDAALDAVQLRGLFDVTRTAEETASKPAPQMLYELMETLGVDSERTLMIGDTTHDLQMAVNAGTASVAVSFGAHRQEAFDDYAPLYVAGSTAELHRWLDVHA